MESDAPYKKTRSSTGSQGQSVEKTPSHAVNLENEVFNQSVITPKRVEKEEKSRVRTPSGHLITHCVEDIRNFFVRKDTIFRWFAANESIVIVNSDKCSHHK